MNRKKWILGSVRGFGYFILISGLLVSGLYMENVPVHIYSLDIVRNGGRASGSGWTSLRSSQENITWAWDLPPNSWIVEDAKYDLDTFTINWSTIFLRARVGGEEGFVTATNVTSDLQYGLQYDTHHVPIQLHYNVSRGEYVALFDLEPYWNTTNYLQITLMVNTTFSGSPLTWSVVILETPKYFYSSFPYALTFLIIGIICVVMVELLISYMRKYRSLGEERRKDQALLRLLRQQNQGAYENALRQLQQDHNQLIRQIQSESRQVGGRADA